MPIHVPQSCAAPLPEQRFADAFRSLFPGDPHPAWLAVEARGP